MQRWFILIVAAIAVLSFSLGAYAAKTIKLFVDGREIKSAIAPQMIKGTTMVPLRTVAEALGLDVKWDGGAQAVIITSKSGTQVPQGNASPTQPNANYGLSRSNPVPMGKSLLTPEGIEVSVNKLTQGNAAWEIIENANQFNEAPDSDHKYALISVKVKNVSSKKNPITLSDTNFSLVGSSNKTFKTYDRSVVLPDDNDLKELFAELYHDGEATGTLHFYVPNNESNLVLVWDPGYPEQNKRFFEVK